nr:putative baseplate assembly protein [Treponema sp.]
MIPKVNLDDRTFEDIKNEAIALIPRYCPEWTNHNPSDPGITLIELFSWMTEMTLYRLNKVPAKTYLSMLELMGLDLTPPQSARAVIEFHTVEGCKKDVEIKQGTKVASITSEEEPIIFETEKNLKVRNSKIVSCVNRVGERWQENCETENKVDSFLLFGTENAVEHSLYIKSETFKYLKDGHAVQVVFDSDTEIASSDDEITKHLSFEYWNGKEWLLVESKSSINGEKVLDNVVYLKGICEIEPTEVNGVEGLFVRAVLADVPKNPNTLKLKSIKVRNVFIGEGFQSELCIANKGKVYDTVDQNNSFRMYAEIPVMNEIFYIACDEVFKNKGTRASIKFVFSEMGTGERANENAIFSYEYWNGHDWKKLDKANNELTDETFAFKQSGKVSFVIPEDMSETDVDNEGHIYIRIKLLPKDFSVGGKYGKNIYGETEWQFEEKVQSPMIEKIRIAYEPKAVVAENILTYTNFQWKDESKFFLENEGEETKSIFSIENESLPSLYLGLSGKVSAGNYPVYFRVDERNKNQQEHKIAEIIGLPASEKEERNINLEWEYWNGNSWRKLDFSDETDFFHESGFIDFNIQEDICEFSMFEKEANWIRCVMKNGSFELPPKIKGIVINCVTASNAEKHENEIIGSGNGAPGQRLRLAHENLLSGMELRIKEESIPSSNEIKMMKADGIENPVEIIEEEAWVKYKEVPNFYNSTPFSRHYTVDYLTGEIQFGDGIKGVNPPKGNFNIKAVEYKTGGGSVGNVAAHKLQYLTRSIAYISGCDNPYPSEGGSDMESIDDLKRRAAGVFKSLERAVAKEDFEWLSMKASGAVGRAYCLKEKQRDGSIRTLIIPKITGEDDLKTELYPSRELIRRVKQHLEERKLVGTKISVGAPIYRKFSLKLTIEFKGNVFNLEEEKRRIMENLRIYFHPLFGSIGNGWEFGKDITVGIVLKHLEKINSIMSVKEIVIFDEASNMSVDALTINDEELPLLDEIEIVERG